MAPRAVPSASSAPSMMAGGERSARCATTSSWHPTGGSLESRATGCLTPRLSGRAPRTVRRER